jgi:uncharacterized iron-regulated protein
MRIPLRFLSLVLVLLAPALAPAAGPPVQPGPFDRQLRQLEKEIEKVRGLKFKRPVVAHVIARGKGDSPHIQGYYDAKKKALYLYDDIKGNYRKGTLIHEMVHALQDQHFGLARQDDISTDSDAVLARAALIEGDATFTMIEVLKKEQPAVMHMLATTLEKAGNLRNAFLYGLGAKFVQHLKNHGGWERVNERYRFAPTSTAVILHPAERIVPVDLGPGKPVGELGIIRLCRQQPATRALAVQAAAGWRGDRTRTEGAGKLWVVAFAKAEQAARFHKALATLRQAEYPKLKDTGEANAPLWKSEKGLRTILLRGTRVVELTAPDEKTCATLIDRIDGPPRLEIYSAKEKKTITFGELTDRLLDADLVCIGETHSSAVDHQVQLMIIKALHARDERLGVGMEMFQRPYQKALDRYIAGSTNETAMLEDTDYRKRWGYDWELYRPIADFCRRNKVPLAALNVSDELRARVRKVGYDKLTAEEKKQIGPVDFNVKAHRDHWFEQLGKMHGHGDLPKEDKERYYRIMTLWDEYMADSAARFQKDRKLRRMVILAGSGHIDRGFGIPDRAARRTGGRAVNLHLQIGGDLAKVKADPPADFVLIVR